MIKELFDTQVRKLYDAIDRQLDKLERKGWGLGRGVRSKYGIGVGWDVKIVSHLLLPNVIPCL